MNNIFGGIFDTGLTSVISLGDFILCIAVSLILGAALSFVFSFGEKATKSFNLTIALLPAVVCVVIMMVNGNVGTGVAVAGAFSLIRFRSAPGTAREIAAIFIAMTSGLIAGMGYLAYAVLFTVVLCLAYFLFSRILSKPRSAVEKTLRITIPENLDYNGVFDDLLEKYTKSHELVSVKTAGMGSLYRLTYNIVMKSSEEEKSLIDALRCRNGNLEISCSVRENAPVSEL